MKRKCLLIALMAMMCSSLMSCREESAENESRMWEVKARIEQPVCDYSTGAEGFSLTWPEGATISLYQKRSQSRPGFVGITATEVKYALKSGAGTAEGVFESPKTCTNDPVTCYYPNSILTSAVDDIIKLPEQNTIPGGMDIGSYPMVAYSRNLEDGIVLKPLMAILQIWLTGNCDLWLIQLFNPSESSKWQTVIDPETASIMSNNNAAAIYGVGFEEPVRLSSKPTVFNILIAPGDDMSFDLKLISKTQGVLTKSFRHQAFKAGVIRKIADFDFENGEDNYEGMGSAVELAGVKWAPVNCGQDEDHPQGLLYQWGRKYGQSYEAGSLKPVKLLSEYGHDRFYEDYFGKAYSNNNNWFSWIDSSLWYEKKGCNDPCPEGWRVPSDSELEKLKDVGCRWVEGISMAGRKYDGLLFGTGSSTLFFPASGRRDLNGSVSGFNESAGYWSCQLNRALSVEENGAELVERPLAEGHHVRCVSNRYD